MPPPVNVLSQPIQTKHNKHSHAQLQQQLQQQIKQQQQLQKKQQQEQINQQEQIKQQQSAPEPPQPQLYPNAIKPVYGNYVDDIENDDSILDLPIFSVGISEDSIKDDADSDLEPAESNLSLKSSNQKQELLGMNQVFY